MTLARTYLIPHGDEILSLPNRESSKMNREIKKGTAGDPSETILIVSPHSLRIPLGLPVINTQHLSGQYKIGKKMVRGRYETDRELNKILIRSSRYFVETNFVTNEGKLSSFPVDFGSLIPLTFFAQKNVSLLGQWRTFRKDLLIRLGMKMFEAVSGHGRKVSVVFSADQAHTHLKTGPYGFDPRAEQYDAIVRKAIEKNDFDELIGLDEEFINGAKPDSYWILLMFYGFMMKGNLKPLFHYYYLQEYFGMLFATAKGL